MWRLLIGIGIIFIYRYALKLSSPARDWWYVEEYRDTAITWIRREANMFRAWLFGLIRYTPTATVKRSWQLLREQLALGLYGEAGT